MALLPAASHLLPTALLIAIRKLWRESLLFAYSVLNTMSLPVHKRYSYGLLLTGCLLTAFCLNCRKIEPNPSANHKAVAVDPLKEAILKLEEPRDSPVGRKAQVSIPPALQHYADRRRFLMMQEAAWSEWHLEIPQGYLELFDLIDKGGLVEMESLGADYLLYGVGENANTDAFHYYDPALGKTIPLFADNEELSRQLQERSAAIAALQAQISELELQRSQIKDRKLLLQVQAQRLDKQRQMETLTEQRAASETFYNDPVRRMLLFTRYRRLSDRASDFKGEHYDITTAVDRRRFKMRLLSFIRPEARAVILQIAAIYKEKFNRHLPVTSLIRTLDYQKQLREVNRNATAIEVPPHTTGLAFDIYNGWMTAEEQAFLMGIIARMKIAGRIEALRENRDHIHVFAFPSGRPPEESRLQAIRADKRRGQ